VEVVGKVTLVVPVVVLGGLGRVLDFQFLLILRTRLLLVRERLLAALLEQAQQGQIQFSRQSPLLEAVAEVVDLLVKQPQPQVVLEGVVLEQQAQI
jgi:hypothetical protein